MSGWFGTSNRGTNTPLSGIAAGHRGRRNHQKNRYRSMGRMTIDQMAQQNMREGAPAVVVTPTGDIQQYRGFKLESTFNAGLNKWVTKANMGLVFFNAVGRSKGESVNAVKSKIDTSLGIVEKQTAIFTDASSASTTDATLPVTDPGEVARFNRLKAQEEARKMFTPVTMPRDFTTGRYTVRAMYNGMSRKYTVSVFEGTVVKEVATFTQDQGAAAVVKHTQFKSLATKKTVYEGKKPLSVAKTNYDVKLQVTTAAAGLSGFFNGIMNIFGLGLTVDQIAEQNRVGPKPDFHAASSASVTTDYTSASNRPEVSAKWSEMPAKSFKVITSRKDGTVVKESGSTSDYLRAVDMFQAEVATIENTPDFYDQDAPLVPEVPTNNGNGGDITSSPLMQNETKPGPVYLDPILTAAENKRASDAAKAKLAEAGRFGRMKEQQVRRAAQARAAAAKAKADKEAARDFLRQEAARAAEQKAAADARAAEQKASEAAAAEAQAKADALKFLQQDARQAQSGIPPVAPIPYNPAWKTREDFSNSSEFKEHITRENQLRKQFNISLEEAIERDKISMQMIEEIGRRMQQQTTTDTTTVYQDPIITQAQTGSENYNELVNAGEDTTTFYEDQIIRQAQNRSAQTYVSQNYEDNPYIIQQATADNNTFKQPQMTSNQTMGLALVGLAGLAYVANRK